MWGCFDNYIINSPAAPLILKPHDHYLNSSHMGNRNIDSNAYSLEMYILMAPSKDFCIDCLAFEVSDELWHPFGSCEGKMLSISKKFRARLFWLHHRNILIKFWCSKIFFLIKFWCSKFTLLKFQHIPLPSSSSKNDSHIKTFSKVGKLRPHICHLWTSGKEIKRNCAG